MTELQEYLEVRGFDERPSQTALYEHLIQATRTGVVAQAGTGTGKSAAILAAGAHLARETGQQSIIVTPTLTLMNQYRDGDTPYAEKAFEDLAFAEVRGMAHYECQQSRDIQEALNYEYAGGCLGFDAGCTQGAFEGHDECPKYCDFPHGFAWDCGYRQARYDAQRADVVVTNADMLIVNDRILLPIEKDFLSQDGALFVDEAHTLEQKLRDFASRSLFWKTVERFKFAAGAGPELGRWLERQERNVDLKDVRGFPREALVAIATAEMPEPHPGDGLTKQREAKLSCAVIEDFMKDPHDSAVLHVSQGSLKMDWINIAKSSGELLSARSFGLVSATVPRTMASTLGVSEAPFVDVGHPFDYANQAWLGFSPYQGDYKSAQSTSNLGFRVQEVKDLLERSKGGALILFSSFNDLDIVSEELRPWLMCDMGLKVLIQKREMEASDRQKLADEFRADGNAVLFGSESFATGFDVPGNALRLVVLWKLPYPAIDPVSNAIRNQNFQRYEDSMRVRAVQAMGRLIRTSDDRGIVWVADSRGRRLVDSTDPLTNHIPQFARI